MKKIAVIMNRLSIGGIEKACVNFVNELSQFAEVTLIMNNSDGEFQNLLSKTVNVEVVSSTSPRLIAKKLLYNKKIFKIFHFLLAYFFYRLFGNWVACSRLVSKFNGKIINKHFDCAMAFHGMNVSHLTRTLYGVDADIKFAYIHGENIYIGKEKKEVCKIFNMFNHIFCVSKMYGNKFVKQYKNLHVVVSPLYVLVNYDEIKNKATESNPFNNIKGCINIVTVGRISKEKGQDLIPNALKKLNNSKFNVKWYLIGDGQDLDRVKALSKIEGVENLICVGASSNPYPYIKNCDIYVQPSYSESYSITTVEAILLNKAVVVSDICGVTELLSENMNSLFCKPNSISIFETIKFLIEHEDIKMNLENNTKKINFSNYDQIKIFLSFIN